MSRRPVRTPPPRWLMAALMGCLTLVLMAVLVRPGLYEPPAQAVEATATPEPTPEPTPTPTPEPTPEPTPPPDYSQPVPEGEAADPESWFTDAVFIGDSRTEGFRMFSGVKGASFLTSTGITVYEVMEGKSVIRAGDSKVSVLTALGSRGPYGKVYISLGVNELGYYDPQGFADTYGRCIDAVRERQPEATVYVQAIIPVNTAKCKANQQPYYVTNENIVLYNEALSALCAEKEVFYLDVSEVFVDETGETQSDLSADGVHFKKEGYALWLDYLTTHTGI